MLREPAAQLTRGALPRRCQHLPPPERVWVPHAADQQRQGPQVRYVPPPRPGVPAGRIQPLFSSCCCCAGYIFIETREENARRPKLLVRRNSCPPSHARVLKTARHLPKDASHSNPRFDRQDGLDWIPSSSANAKHKQLQVRPPACTPATNPSRAIHACRPRVREPSVGSEPEPEPEPELEPECAFSAGRTGARSWSGTTARAVPPARPHWLAIASPSTHTTHTTRTACTARTARTTCTAHTTYNAPHRLPARPPPSPPTPPPSLRGPLLRDARLSAAGAAPSRTRRHRRPRPTCTTRVLSPTRSAACYSLLITHYALRTTHYALRTTHSSLRTTHYSLLTTHYHTLTHYALQV